MYNHVAVVRLHDGDLHAVGWAGGPGALVTPVKDIRVGVFFPISQGTSSKMFNHYDPNPALNTNLRKLEAEALAGGREDFVEPVDH